jgi:hypothetical protein
VVNELTSPDWQQSAAPYGPADMSLGDVSSVPGVNLRVLGHAQEEGENGNGWGRAAPMHQLGKSTADSCCG